MHFSALFKQYKHVERLRKLIWADPSRFRLFAKFKILVMTILQKNTVAPNTVI